jgi:hypothetical protein
VGSRSTTRPLSPVDRPGAAQEVPGGPDRTAPPPLRVRRELLWFVLPLSLCPIVALARPGDAVTALARADRLLAWQRAVGVAVEPSVHAWVGARPVLAHLVEAFYLAAHLSALIATALWLAVRHRQAYVRFRGAFAVAQVMTVAIYVLWPVAPLRMALDDRATTTAGWTRSVQYEFAAMPSGHVVFATLVALAVWASAPGRWRGVGPLHLALTVGAVVATAHHLLVDAAAGLAVAVVATAVVGRRPVAGTGQQVPAATPCRAISYAGVAAPTGTPLTDLGRERSCSTDVRIGRISRRRTPARPGIRDARPPCGEARAR